VDWVDDADPVDKVEPGDGAGWRIIIFTASKCYRLGN